MLTFSLVRDLRFAWRTLRRRLPFAALAIATLGLGIGATTSLFTVIDGVLLRPLPYPDAHRLIRIHQTFPDWRGRDGLSAMWDRMGVSHPQFREWQRQQQSFVAVAARARSSATLTGAGAADQIEVMRTSASMLEVLGIEPSRGRFFLPGEDVSPGAKVAVISQRLWNARFGGASDVLGQSLTIDGVPHEVVGVLPPRLDAATAVADIWIPAGGSPSDAQAQTTDYLLIGRVRPDLSIERAAGETNRLFAGHAAGQPRGARLVAWAVEAGEGSRRPLLMLLGASTMLLLLACVNVALLLLGEMSGRVPEFATRVALGAGWSTIARQIVVECTLLVAAAILLGSTLAVIWLRVLAALAPTTLSQLVSLDVDIRILGFASAAGAFTIAATAAIPIFAAGRFAEGVLSQTAHGERSTRGFERQTVRALVATQFALSLILLIGAGLLGRSLHLLTRIDPGFATERLLVLSVGVPGGARADRGAAQSLYARLGDRIAALPGVARVAAGSSIPFTGGGSSNRVEIQVDTQSASLAEVNARRSHVSPEFRSTLGLRLLAGRDIDQQDVEDAPPVAMVNETLARRYWPGRSAVGRRVRMSGTWHTVVGVVSDVRHASLAEAIRATVYVGDAQQPTRYLALLVRAACANPESCDLDRLQTEIRSAVAEVDASVPVRQLEAMDDLVARSFAPERFRTVLITTFAGIATLLAASGIYGTVSGAVRRRRREIAIRMALGCSSGRLARTFTGGMAWSVALGAAAGFLTMSAASHLLAPLLYGVSSFDPATYAGAAAVLGIVAAAATVIPVRRAAAESPSSVLRSV